MSFYLDQSNRLADDVNYLQVTIADGDYAIKPGSAHRVTIGGRLTEVTATDAGLVLNAEAGGHYELRVRPARR